MELLAGLETGNNLQIAVCHQLSTSPFLRRQGALTIFSPDSFQFSKMAFYCVTKSRKSTTNEFEYVLINGKLNFKGPYLHN